MGVAASKGLGLLLMGFCLSLRDLGLLVISQGVFARSVVSNVYFPKRLFQDPLEKTLLKRHC